MPKFQEKMKIVYSHELHQLQNGEEHISEKGAYIFEGNHNGKKIQVTLENADKLKIEAAKKIKNDYTISKVKIDGEQIDLKQIEKDKELSGAINKLSKEYHHDTNPENYTYSIEDKKGNITEKISYKEMKQLTKNEHFISDIKSGNKDTFYLNDNDITDKKTESYKGIIYGETKKAIIQQTQRGLIVHNKNNLSGLNKINRKEPVEISYPYGKAGIARSQTPNEHDKTHNKNKNFSLDSFEK